MKILYIGKKNVLIEQLQFYLTEMIIDNCEEFWDGLSLAQSGIYCLVIINTCGCPEWSLGVIRFRRSSDVPIAILSDRYRFDEKKTAFAVGANDYITGINDIIALSARVVRYKHRLCELKNKNNINDFKEFTIDVDREKLYHNGEYVRLTKREFELFYLLLSHKGEILSHKKLGEHLYGREQDLKSRRVMSNVFGLRSKVEEGWGEHEYVRTVIGEGYVLTDEDMFIFV